MKLLLVMSHASPWSLEIAASLRARGHEVHVLDFEAPSNEYMPTRSRYTREVLASLASVTLLPRSRFGWARILQLTRGMRSASRRIRPEVMLCLYAGRFACAAYLSGVRPYVVFAAGSDVLLANAGLRFINRHTFAAAAHVFANGAHLVEAARAQSPDATVENLVLGVDSEQIALTQRSGPARLFTHRWFAPIYNNESILRALALLPPDLPPFEMIFAADGPELGAARALAAKILPARLRSAVHFLEGKLGRLELLAELSRSDIFISMSRSDAIPLSVVEAMMAGLHPVLSDIPGNRSLVDVERGIGTLIKKDDIPALARELARRITDVEQCRDNAERIRDHVIRIASSAKTRERLADRLTEIAVVSRAARQDPSDLGA